jgi:hypothetical protein
MNKQQTKLTEIRHRLMADRKVLCTGNPNDLSTLASGFKKIFPNITFIHQSAGWDLTDQSDSAKSKLITLFSQHNTFINASYIAPGIQTNLLTLCHQSVKHCDVFNIGSTHEYDGLGSAEYQKSKLSLQAKSLQLNTYRFQTHHIIVGKIHKKLDLDDSDNAIAIDTICSIIPWIIQQPFKVPLICIDQPKLPW